MCGICVEELSIYNVTAEELAGRIPDIDELTEFLPNTAVALQETVNLKIFISVLESIIGDDIENNIVIADIIVCRLLAHLSIYGISPDYKILMGSPLVNQSINAVCSNNIKDKPANRFDNKIDPMLLEVYNPDFYRTDEGWNELIAQDKIISRAEIIIEEYINWWLKGKDLKKGSPYKQISGGGTIVDHLFVRDENECAYFFSIFLVVFLSLLILLKVPEHKFVKQVLTTLPSYMTDFVAMDLWLRRIAIKHNPEIIDTISSARKIDKVYSGIIKRMYKKGISVF